jgi:hypothetical protein
MFDPNECGIGFDWTELNNLVEPATTCKLHCMDACSGTNWSRFTLKSASSKPTTIIQVQFVLYCVHFRNFSLC